MFCQVVTHPVSQSGVGVRVVFVDRLKTGFFPKYKKAIGHKSYDTPFLDASTHLYMRVCPSVVPSFRRSVVPSFRRSVVPSRIFFLNAEIDKSEKSGQSNTPAN